MKQDAFYALYVAAFFLVMGAGLGMSIHSMATGDAGTARDQFEREAIDAGVGERTFNQYLEPSFRFIYPPSAEPDSYDAPLPPCECPGPCECPSPH